MKTITDDETGIKYKVIRYEKYLTDKEVVIHIVPLPPKPPTLEEEYEKKHGRGITNAFIAELAEILDSRLAEIDDRLKKLESK